QTCALPIFINCLSLKPIFLPNNNQIKVPEAIIPTAPNCNIIIKKKYPVTLNVSIIVIVLNPVTLNALTAVNNISINAISTSGLYETGSDNDIVERIIAKK